MKKRTIKLSDGDRRLFMITGPISGNVAGAIIKAGRGTLAYLSADEAKVFKDQVLEITEWHSPSTRFQPPPA